MANEEEVKKFLIVMEDSFKLLMETLSSFQKRTEESSHFIQQGMEREGIMTNAIIALNKRVVVLETIVGNKVGKELDSFLQRVVISGDGN